MNQATAIKPTTKDKLWQLLKDSDEWTVGALLALYRCQTLDEQYSHSTKEDNAVGFNALDAHDMTSIAKFYEDRGFLTSPQIKYVRRVIAKYTDTQLLGLPFGPEPIKRLPKRDETEQKTVKWAGFTNNGKDILIKFNFPRDTEGKRQFQEALANVKTLDGRRFEPEKKAWTALLGIENVQALITWDFEVAPKLQEWWEKMTREVNGDTLDVPGLKMQLYPFQKQGVAFIDDREGRALIGDEMGLGKTAQALAWLQLHPEARPAVIIVPASIKLNWAKEAKMWMSSPELYIINGRPNGDHHWQAHQVTQSATGDGPIIIINYDILANVREKVKDERTGEEKKVPMPRTGWVDWLIDEKPKAVILDEIHFCKNPKAFRTKDCKKLTGKAEHVIGLSGTPITNRPMEFFPGLQMIQKELFPNFWHFAKKYCGAVNNGWGWDFGGATNTEELHDLLVKTVMLRRLKKEVLPDLPEKTISVLPIEIDNRAEYRKAERSIIDWIEENEGLEKAEQAKQAEVLIEFEKLKQLAAKGKMKQAIKWIEDFLESTDEKLVVFATHHAVIDQIMESFKGISVKLDGRDSQKKRQEAVDLFQGTRAVMGKKSPIGPAQRIGWEDVSGSEKIRLFVGNIKAAGIGITLTAASKTCFLELGWTPGEHVQAEDRVHRIGQENAVIAYYLVAERTIEEEIAALLDSKKKVLDMVLDGKNVEEESLLTELLNRMREGGKYDA